MEFSRDEQMMALALQEAKIAAQLGETPVGAVLTWDDEVLVTTHNLRETERMATAHAELLAIEQACRKLGGWRLHRAVLYVTLEPCPMCAGAILMAGVDEVVFGAADPQKGCAGSVYALPEDPALGGFIRCMGGLLEEECAQVLRSFFDARRGSA